MMMIMSISIIYMVFHAKITIVSKWGIGYTTICDAIANTGNGDYVIVFPGTYKEIVRMENWGGV